MADFLEITLSVARTDPPRGGWNSALPDKAAAHAVRGIISASDPFQPVDNSLQVRRVVYITLTLFVAVFGVASAWMPEPFNKLGMFLFIIGFLMLIGSGHRAASRADSAGIFAFWWKPAKMATAEVDEPDHWPATLALVATISPLVSMLSRIVWLA